MSNRQLAMVINLDKCIGCQTCTVACSTHRLNRPGTEMLRYIWCETKPGLGWPKGWMDMGRKVPDRVSDYGGTWQFNWEEVYTSKVGTKYLHPLTKESGQPPQWGPVWDEDQGGGEWPNGYFFYMPRLCNHCTNATCVTACEAHFARGGGMPGSQGNGPIAMHKREEDGIVVIDAASCDECALCVAACPYKIPMENLEAGTFEMCDFCISRVEHEYAPVCAKSCPARGMYFGYLDDEESFTAKLVKKYKVALPLRPDYGTEPNVYYVPPFIRPNRLGAGNQPEQDVDIPIELLRTYFGAEVDQAIATLREHREKAERGEPSELMDLLIIYRWADAFAPLKVEAPLNPIG
ncbi:MAG: 4Fe-4S dicluster domain-containing protein [Candidatus Binataceae bacterium]